MKTRASSFSTHWASRPRNVHSRRGFTIIELLVVVVLIAILVAITIVTYNGIQNRARASQASAALAEAKKKLEMHKVVNNSYPVTGNLDDAGVTDDSTTYQYTSDSTAYCLTATVANVSYYLNSTTVASPTQGGCSGHGQGGVSAITNLATNPSAENSAGWLSNNGSMYPKTWDSGRARTGSYSTSSANVAASTVLLSLYGVGAAAGDNFPVSENTTYVLSVYFTADVAHRAQLACDFRVGGVFQGFVYSAFVGGTIGAWTRVTQVCNSPAGANALRPLAAVYSLVSQPAGTRAYVDDFMTVASGSAPAYADGSSPNWVWNGTPNASTSTGPAL